MQFGVRKTILADLEPVRKLLPCILLHQEQPTRVRNTCLDPILPFCFGTPRVVSGVRLSNETYRLDRQVLVQRY